jgi:large subunit ribosomal protein L31
MRENIHPTYNTITVQCACGNSFVTRSTAPRIRLEICSNCHPFYTGRQRLVDTAGRVERFEKRFAKTGGKTIVRKPTSAKAAPKATAAAKKVLRNTPLAAPTAKPKPAKSAKPAKPAEKK